ncbi:DUF2163 domain-containing protein [Aquabacter cavernae]|uniref:DUF2163 domain-containing protein n=1 Tax=Aquabacter cavernae TaxID=2496029 RepID=UPI000F8EC4F1|nr:DUF2163 domain-containing protein [Aquabacter cavernae]
MRQVPGALQAMLESGVTTLCHGWRVTRRDGQVMGFTDHDRDLVVDGLAFVAGSGVQGSESVLAQGLGVTGLELSGALGAATLEEADLAAGQYDGAGVDQLLIDWSNPLNHMLLRRGTIGEVRREGGAFVAELRGPADALNETRGRLFGAPCDADFGDARCGVDLDRPERRASAVVAQVRGALLLAVDGIAGYADGTFADGHVRFSSGANVGFATKVKHHAAGVLQLWQRPPEPVLAGDGLVVIAGCDKRFSTCRDRFANTVNFRGFPHMPGNDFVVSIAVPGEGGNDGSVLA